MFSSSIFKPIFDIQASIEEFLMNLPNVVGVAAGFKESGGVITEEPSVVVLVQQKKPDAGLDEGARIPKEVNGVKTDVYEVGYLQAQQATSPRQRFRPVPAGVSIGHYQVTAGTLGAVVRDRTTGARLILSNNHVLANNNVAVIGDPILQPGATDGGMNPGDVVAYLERFIPLNYIEGPVTAPQPAPSPGPAPTNPAPAPSPSPGTPGNGSTPPTQSSGCDVVDALVGFSNLLAMVSGSEKRIRSESTAQTAQAQSVAPAPAPAAERTQQTTTAQNAPQPGQPIGNIGDCAVARLADGIVFNEPIMEIGVVRQTGVPALGMQVRKFGRTTGLRQGKVTLLNATVNVGYNTPQGTRTARFTGQVICDPISEGGDSGALVVQQDAPIAVGLLFGGSPLASLFTPIDVIMNALNIEFRA